MKNEKGFTLIELMYVVVIIGILAAIAIPQFSRYRQKANTSEGYVLGGEIRKEIMDFYNHTGRFPKDNREAGLPEPTHIMGKQVESITVHDGAFDVRFYENVSTRYLVLTARPAILKEDPTASVYWIWGDKDVPGGMTVFGENRSKKREKS